MGRRVPGGFASPRHQGHFHARHGGQDRNPYPRGSQASGEYHNGFVRGTVGASPEDPPAPKD